MTPAQEAELDAWAEKQVDKAPPATEAQIRTLAAVLNDGSQRVAS